MTLICRILIVLALAGACLPAVAVAQEASEQPISRYAFDVHLALPKVPASDELGQPYDVAGASLPGLGVGVNLGAHVYPLRLKKKIAVGFGVSGVVGTAHASPFTQNGTVFGKDVSAHFSGLAPQVSINFGSAAGWSYLSGGIASARLEIRTPDVPPDTTWPRTKTINYGGGGRWWIKDRMAASFDVRFYAMNPVAGSPDIASLPTDGSPKVLRAPRLRMLVISMGVSFR